MLWPCLRGRLSGKAGNGRGDSERGGTRLRVSVSSACVALSQGWVRLGPGQGNTREITWPGPAKHQGELVKCLATQSSSRLRGGFVWPTNGAVSVPVALQCEGPALPYVDGAF